MRGYASSKAYQKALRKRQVWVEPLFGEGKQWHGLGRFRLRRLWRVNIEALLIAAGLNLKRLLKAWGWGRRRGPTGATMTAEQAEGAFFGLMVLVVLAAASQHEARRHGEETVNTGRLVVSEPTFSTRSWILRIGRRYLAMNA